MDANKVLDILTNIKKKKQTLSLFNFKFNELIKIDTWISELNPQDMKIGFLTKRFKVVEAILGSREEVFLYSEDSRILLSSKFLKIVDNELHVSFPDHSSVTDLRQDVRMDMDLKLQVMINGKKQAFETFDIGYNGLSIIVKENQKASFKEEMVLKGSVLFLIGKKILLNVEVKNLIKMEAYSYNDIPFAFYRVGMLFVDTSDKKKDFIKKVIDIKKSVG